MEKILFILHKNIWLKKQSVHVEVLLVTVQIYKNTKSNEESKASKISKKFFNGCTSHRK